MINKSEIISKKAPVLLILFNRVDITKRLLDSLSYYLPDQLYIHFDGPRENFKKEDTEKIEKIISLINLHISWECDINIKKAISNIGSADSPKKAIDWFFENVEYGVILEDDCIPEETFFQYCEVLLSKYNTNPEVFMISGDNGGEILEEQIFGKSDYLFTKIPLTWGWATWKNRWEKIDRNFTSWSKSYFYNRKNLKYLPFFESYLIYKMLKRISNRSEKNWDYLLYSTMIKSKSLSIIPRYNQIENIGWGQEATHTKSKNFRSYAETKKLKSFKTYSNLVSDQKNDLFISYKVHFGVDKILMNETPLFKIRISYIIMRIKYLMKVFGAKLSFLN